MYTHKSIEENQSMTCQQSLHINTIIVTISFHSSFAWLYWVVFNPHIFWYLASFPPFSPMLLFLLWRDFNGLFYGQSIKGTAVARFISL